MVSLSELQSRVEDGCEIIETPEGFILRDLDSQMDLTDVLSLEEMSVWLDDMDAFYTNEEDPDRSDMTAAEINQLLDRCREMTPANRESLLFLLVRAFTEMKGEEKQHVAS